jgi:hypothetical protein
MHADFLLIFHYFTRIGDISEIKLTELFILTAAFL